MLSTAALIGLASLTFLLAFFMYILRRLGAEELALALAVVVAIGVAAALVSAVLA